ncbi:MAG: Holliday junction resolvase [Eubacteriaceae bacterium]|nr:Holliday junction resolvase [Eubacteriaceae bacterium]
MKRILGIDVGDKRIGIAVTDPLHITAQGVIANRLKPERQLTFVSLLKKG